jgi:hypothetical protein
MEKEICGKTDRKKKMREGKGQRKERREKGESTWMKLSQCRH